MSMATASSQTVIAVLLSELGFAKAVVGLPMAIGIMGFAMAQVPAAFLASRAARRSTWLFGLRVAASFPVLVAAGGAMVASPGHPWASAVLLFLPIFLASLLGGGSRPIRAQLDAALIPQRKRGRFYGAALIVGGGCGMLGAGLARLLLHGMPSRGGFAACLLASAALGAGAAAPLRYLCDPTGRGSNAGVRLSAYVASLRQAIARDLNFRNFLWARVLVGLGYMSAAFYAVFALEKLRLPAATAPLFMLPGLLGQGMGSALWGFVGDRKGHRVIQIAICVQWALAGLVALVAPNAWVFAVAFWLMGMSNAGDFISTNNFMIESAPREDTMGYVSFANTLIAPIFALATVLGGVIAGATSYYVLFGLSIAVYLAAIWVMVTLVKDPRANGTGEAAGGPGAVA